MKKPYLLIAGDNYYPSSDTGDWIGCYETYDEAKEQVKEIEPVNLLGSYEVNGEYGVRKCDWYEIIDLRDWAE